MIDCFEPNSSVRGWGSALEEDVMDKDRVAGSAKEIKGAIKQGIGKAVGAAKLETEGKADKAEGNVQNAIGGLKDTVRETAGSSIMENFHDHER